MYAIVDVKDKQFKVRENDTLYVPLHADAEVDDTLTLDRVLLLSNGEGDVTVGTPTVDGASVTARVLDHVQGDKVLVFKKKRRKRYRVKRGHRQKYTQIQIERLNANGSAPAPPASDSAPADEAPMDDSAEEAPADDTSADKTPADKTPADETPADETPADDADETTSDA